MSTHQELLNAILEYQSAMMSEGKPTGGFVPKTSSREWNMRVVKAAQDLDEAIQNSVEEINKY